MKRHDAILIVVCWLLFAAGVAMGGFDWYEAIAATTMLACNAVVAGATNGAHPGLGLVNWCVLQWFGVRLARQVEHRPCWTRSLEAGEVVRPGDIELRSVPVGWTVQRWIWPLTGWWNDYRWIARRR
jgi:hypothetical protein